MSHNLCRTHHKAFQGKRGSVVYLRALKPLSAVLQVVMVVKHAETKKKNKKKGLLMFYFFQKVTGAGWGAFHFNDNPFLIRRKPAWADVPNSPVAN